MIYVTGDIHGNPVRLSYKNFPEGREMTKDDVVIICGDFGLIWNQEECDEERYYLDWLNNRNFTTVFVDGNHENFDRLYNYPIKEWNGGSVHEIRSSVLHLMRGEIFTIQEKKIFAFGGARSHDISDGILNPDDYKPGEFRKVYNDWWDAGKMFRVKNISWWEREMPIPEEMGNGLNNLDECRNNVDFIISHCGPASTVALFSAGTFKPDTLTKYFEEIRQRVKYKKWIFGHYHMNKNVTDKDICIYEQIIRIV